MSAQRKTRSQKGSTLAEFAVVVVLLLVMLLGIVDFGRALYTYHFLSNAARDATRWASVSSATCGSDCIDGPASLSTLTTYVNDITPPGIDPDKITPGIRWPGNTVCAPGVNAPGCPVVVTLTYRFNFVAPIVLDGGSVQMSSSSEMTISH